MFLLTPDPFGKAVDELVAKILNSPPRGLFAKVRYRINGYRLKLAMWSWYRSRRRVARLRNLATLLIDSEVRFLRPQLPQLGNSDEIDCAIEVISRQLAGRELREVDRAAYAAQESFIDELNDEAQQSDEVKAACLAYFRLQYPLLRSATNVDPAVADAALAAATALDASFEPIATNKDIRALTKRMRRRMRYLQKGLAERSAFKFDIAASEAVTWAGVISTLFLISGYLYIHYYLAAFSVSSSAFYSLTDYLVMSIEQLQGAAMNVIYVLIAVAVGIRQASLTPKYRRELQRSKADHGSVIVVGLALIMIVTGGLLVFQDLNGGISLLRFGSLLVSYAVVDALVSRFFRRPLHAYIALITVSVFSINLAAAGVDAVVNARNGVGPFGANVSVRFKGPTFPGQARSTLIAANSTYLFFLAPDKKTVHVIPRDQVLDVLIGATVRTHRRTDVPTSLDDDGKDEDFAR